ncbi:hypothetical protein Glove_21g247 [Diversispora epigaea]|uniref:Ubiquitin-like domain-containing protein n=1 Tax=Diversispora epigaea TaxID=1348612 RepID=A0A397JW37_9GLOM|nr:hypothetical protein Glove_21g247 [Diversispora epigaea]
MKIYVETLKGKPIEIEINPSERILKIKQFLEKLYGIPSNGQRLYFFGEILDDNSTIASYGIQKESTIHLRYLLRENMRINVEISYKTSSTVKIVTIGVKPTDTIKDIKNKIKDINAYTKLHHRDQELRDNRNLSSYNIQDDSTITCNGISISNVESLGIEIFVKISTGKIITLQVESNATIERVKELIHDTLGVSNENQHLIFANKPLKDGMTLQDYGIQKESILHLIQRFIGG